MADTIPNPLTPGDPASLAARASARVDNDDRLVFGNLASVKAIVQTQADDMASQIGAVGEWIICSEEIESWS